MISKIILISIAALLCFLFLIVGIIVIRNKKGVGSILIIFAALFLMSGIGIFLFMDGDDQDSLSALSEPVGILEMEDIEDETNILEETQENKETQSSQKRVVEMVGDDEEEAADNAALDAKNAADEIAFPTNVLTELDALDFSFIGGYSDMESLTGSLASVNETKEYSFTLNKQAVIVLVFEHENLTKDTNGWKIYLKNDDGETLLEFTSKWNVTSTASSVIGLPEGNYTIFVSSYNSHSDAEFKLTTASLNQTAFEAELNNELKSANELDISEKLYTIYGSLTTSSDSDYYKFTLTEDSVVAFAFEHENLTTDSSGWKIRIRRSEDSELLAEISSNMNITKAVSPNVAVEAGDYFIEVVCGYSHSSAVYGLTLAVEEGDSWEKEINNNIASATDYSIGEYIYGSLADDSDVDYYLFTVSESAAYKLRFSHDNLTKDSTGWELRIVNKDSQDVMENNLYSLWNEAYTESEEVYLESGKEYYIIVSSRTYSSETYSILLK